MLALKDKAESLLESWSCLPCPAVLASRDGFPGPQQSPGLEAWTETRGSLSVHSPSPGGGMVFHKPQQVLISPSPSPLVLVLCPAAGVPDQRGQLHLLWPPGES